MSSGDIALILVSGLGVIHGLFLSIFLWTYTKGYKLSNRLLGLLLLVLSFRVGKSVFLEFAENLDIKLVFIGLGTIMAIGPLFYLFARASSSKTFRINKLHYAQFIPAFIGVCFGFWLEESHTETIPIWIFAMIFLGYYLHFLFYLIWTWKYTRKTKHQIPKEVYDLLMLLFYSLLGVWVVYALNLFDENIPYIIGPVLYSALAYYVSFVVIRKGFIEKIDHSKYKTTPVSQEQINNLFEKVIKTLELDDHYKDSELSLKSLSEAIHVSPQVLSLVINQKSEMNFNSFVNGYRVKEAAKLLSSTSHANQTIAAVAFEVGFNSISSFNTAFKKQFKETPQSYRNR